MKYILRTYQRQAVEKLLWSQKLDGADLAILPTGSGKSIVIAELSQRLNQPILILQPTKEILEQNYEKLKTVVGKNKIGIYSASMSRKEINTYTLATIGSIYKKPEEFSHFNHVIVDECHLVNPKKMGSMYAKFFAKIGHPKVTGFTATPYRLYQMYERLPDGSLVSHTTTKLINRLREHFWHRIIFNITTAELIEQGHLVPLKYIDKSLISHASIPTNISKSDFDMDAFTKAMLKKEDEIIDNIFLARELGKHVLVFCPTVDMAEKLADIVPDSDVVTAKTKKKDRTRIIGDFRSGKLHTVFNVGVLTTGFDYPELDAIVLLRPTQSIGLYYQILGRGVRPFKGKKYCNVIDITGTVAKIGKIETIKLGRVDEKWEILSEKGSWHYKPLYTHIIKPANG